MELLQKLLCLCVKITVVSRVYEVMLLGSTFIGRIISCEIQAVISPSEKCFIGEDVAYIYFSVFASVCF